MISQKNRFHGYNSLRFVYTRGKTVRAKDFAVRVALNKRRKEYRAAVVVSKKVSKSAVVRNRIRRRIYEQIRLNQDNIPAIDLVVTVYSESMATSEHQYLKDSLTTVIKQAIDMVGGNQGPTSVK